ncbi:MAG: dethiobiotin synthase [Chloroflexota bacterium]|nr:dethiobiotin synthase [Chloroflexota bacterium]
MRTLFVTGTDTDVGKTMVCGCLVQYLYKAGVDVCVQKWASTGNRYSSDDIEFCLKLLGTEGRSQESMSELAPYTFGLAASPHLAAEVEGRQIEASVIRENYHRMTHKHELLVVEGVGGVMVPLTRELILIDLLQELSLPTLIVARTKLGTINHTLLTIEALRRRNIDILGIVFNSLGGEDDVIARDNVHTIAHTGKVEVLGVLPEASLDQCVQAFEPIGERIFAKMGGISAA